MAANREWFESNVFNRTPPPVVTVAVLPGFPLQARHCLDAGPLNAAIGVEALKELKAYQDSGFDVGFFLHTSLQKGINKHPATSQAPFEFTSTFRIHKRHVSSRASYEVTSIL